MSNVDPPELKPDESYKAWKDKIRIWEKCTSTAAEARAPRIALSLKGAAEDVALKIPLGTLAAAGGVDELLTRLDGLFKEDEDQMTFNVYDQFEKFRRTEGMSMIQYMVKFVLKYKIKVTFYFFYLIFSVLKESKF